MKTLLVLAFTFGTVLGPALAAGGCGEGWHRGPHGGCRRNFVNPAQHACPRGYHIGPRGHCRANGR